MNMREQYFRRILLVEDNEASRKVANHLLGERGYLIENAINGREALEILSKNNFDLVLMDIEMPIMDGFEATQSIRQGKGGEQNTKIPIIATTAHIGKFYKNRCFEVGMNGYISKPISFDELESVITSIFDSMKVSNSDIIDLDTALSLYNGDSAFLTELFLLFKKENPGKIEKLKNLLFTKDKLTVEVHKKANIIAHTVKGDASAIGALKLQKACQKLETCLKEENCIGLARQLFPEVESEFSKVMEFNLVTETD